MSRPEEQFVGVEPNELINRVIIGPSRLPYVLADAFVARLEAAGVTDAGKKVFVSDILLRTM
jgi:hypothetical protein